MRAPKILIQKDSEGQWYVSYRGANGKIVGVSRGYNTQHSAIRGVLALTRILRNGFWEFPK